MDYIKEIDEITNSFEKEFGALTFEELNRKPTTNTWSIAQNISHLMRVNQTYFPILKALKTNTYKRSFMGKLNFMVSFFGKMILGSVQPDRKRKIKTFPIWEPSQSNIPADIIEQFKFHQSELKRWILDSEDFIRQKVIISSPANKNIVYRIDTAFEIIVTHEKRHLEQAREVLNFIKMVE